MEKKTIKFGDIKFEKQKFHQPISTKNRDINKIVISNKAFFRRKRFIYFIGYKDV